MATSADPDDVTLKAPLGADFTIRATGSFNATGYTFALVVTQAAAVVLTKTLASPTQANPCIADFPILEADTAAFEAGTGIYRFAIWRTNLSNKHKLAGGPLEFAATPEVATV